MNVDDQHDQTEGMTEAERAAFYYAHRHDLDGDEVELSGDDTEAGLQAETTERLPWRDRVLLPGYLLVISLLLISAAVMSYTSVPATICFLVLLGAIGVWIIGASWYRILRYLGR